MNAASTWVVTWVQQRDGINEWSVAVGDGEHHCPIWFESKQPDEHLVRQFLNRGIDRSLGMDTP